MKFDALLFLIILFSGFELDVLSASPAEKPNVILVFIDDMGWEDFSCFGNKDAKTPYFDRMAKEGIAFDQFYVNSPICSPSRVAISTGQYPQRWGITSYLAHRDNNKKRGMANWLDLKAPMLARCLKTSGYATGHFGKWHMGGQRDVRDAPEISEYGFDQSLTNFEGLGAKLLPMTKSPGGQVGKIWEHAETLGGPVTWMQRSEITTGFINSALKFMKAAKKNKQPFYVNIWPDDVHNPLWPPVERWGNGSKRGRFLGVLEAMDQQFKKLFEFIRSDEKLTNNTLILICSDNGCAKGEGRAGPFKGYKTHLYEGGIRSPLIVWGPGFIEKKATGSRNRESIFSAIDLAPSLLEFTAAKSDQVKFDGENVMDTLLGKSTLSRKKPLFFSRPPDRKSFYGIDNLPDLAMRENQWKMMCDYDGSRLQLYDLAKDPGESHNLVNQHEERAKDMSSRCRNWYKKVLNSHL